MVFSRIRAVTTHASILSGCRRSPSFLISPTMRRPVFRESSHRNGFKIGFVRFFSELTALHDDTDASMDHKRPSCSEYDFSSRVLARKSDGGLRQRRPIKSLLILGDGDLSFGSLVTRLSNERSGTFSPDTDITVTVLEERDRHSKIYGRSRLNERTIVDGGGRTQYGVDATRLSEFVVGRYDRVQFNFPHWQGKNNNRRNRQLIADMLKSAMEVLTEPVVDSVTASSSPDDVSYIVPPGEIHVALVEHQGGVTSRSDQEWKMSWMVPVHAAAAGLLQVGLEPFQVSYSRASYRGVDKPFHVKEMPQLHIFAKSDGVLECPKSLQLCCRFELHISLPPQKDENCWNDTKTKRRQLSRDEILDAYIIRSHVQPLMPRGMEADVSFAGVFTRGQVDCDGLSSAAHLIVLRGVRRPVVREECDALRAKIEEAMLEICSLRGDKTGRMVSKPIPYDLLRRKWEADENNGVDARSWGSR